MDVEIYKNHLRNTFTSTKEQNKMRNIFYIKAQRAFHIPNIGKKGRSQIPLFLISDSLISNSVSKHQRSLSEKWPELPYGY